MAQTCKKHKSRTCTVCTSQDGGMAKKIRAIVVSELVTAACGHKVKARDTRRFRNNILCKDCHAFAT